MNTRGVVISDGASDPTLTHVRALDGMRAVAVLAVMGFHLRYIGAGWAGVQMFFVLSGFLITSILIADKHYPLASYLERFYWRRSLRIFPLYFAFIGILGIVALSDGPSAAFRQQWPYLVTYTFNYRRFLPDYIAQRYWGHLWSLSVEEQFYLLWPALIYFVPRRALGRLFVTLVVATPLLRFAIETAFSGRTVGGRPAYWLIYYVTVCHLDAFASGALVAYTRGSRQVRHPVRLCLLMTVIVLGVGFLHQLTIGDAMFLTVGYPWALPFHYQASWGYTILNLWSATLVITLLQENRVTRLFRWRPLAHIGKISYGVYLFHLPILVIAQDQLNLPLGSRSLEGLFAFALYLAVTLAVSQVSYVAFERRFLALKNTRFVRPARTNLEGPSTVAAGP
jgi:peptidoglycan/LPS O-acetylase OafA/YrhL